MIFSVLRRKPNKIQMKKIILLVAIASISIAAKSQNNARTSDQSRFSMGTKGGFGHTWIAPYKNNFNGSWFIGLATMYQASEHIGIGADALYSSEGASYKVNDATVNTQLDYFRIPLKVAYYFKPTDSELRPKVCVAPNIGFLMSDPKNTSAGYEDMDFGVNVSAGLDYQMLDGFWLTFDANYYNGFMDVYKGNSGNDMNRNLRLDIGLMIGF
jgi:outer membrane protein W